MFVLVYDAEPSAKTPTIAKILTHISRVYILQQPYSPQRILSRGIICRRRISTVAPHLQKKKTSSKVYGLAHPFLPQHFMSSRMTVVLNLCYRSCLTRGSGILSLLLVTSSPVYRIDDRGMLSMVIEACKAELLELQGKEGENRQHLS